MKFLSVLLFLFAICPVLNAAKPNIIVVMADDFGYECVTANGGQSYQTPNLDRLAANGVRFEQCHVQPLCTPTRVQLMTGRFNIRNYINFGTLPRTETTFAHLLKAAGYSTAICGKWQLGREKDSPQFFGFDESCLWQHTRRPPRYANPGLEYNGVEKDFKNGEYGPTLVNDFAIDFITRQREKPFFLYYPLMLTHDPFQPTPDSANWDPKAVGENVNKSAKHFADMTNYMDKLIGLLDAKLSQLGIRDNTLLLFIGDNGTNKTLSSRFKGEDYAGGKGTTTKRGTHVPLIASWPSVIKSGQVNRDLISSVDILPTICEAAGVSIPANIDGVSFEKQLRGERGTPRNWLYSWYSPRQQADLTVREYSQNQHYKLYRTGEFFDLAVDPFEKHPLKKDSLSGAAKMAVAELQKVLDQFSNARPAELDLAFAPAAAQAAKPNIILIMSDDMGWSDLGCYGSEISTPNIDGLAKRGVRFTQFYNTARCCPTRATLLTGLYAHQAGIGHMMEDLGSDAYRGDLNRRCVTIAEVLKTAGYSTYMTGKWHVTKKVNPKNDAERSNWPLQRGFDRFYGTIHGAGSFFDPNSLARDNTLISPFVDPEYRPGEFYYTDAITDQATRFVGDHVRDHSDKPFFMYMAYTAPHWPMHAKAADIEKYKGKYDAGYDAIRKARFERLVSLGLIDAKSEMAPQSGGAWKSVANREFELRCMEVFAAMIDTLDQGVGRLVTELERTKQLENTLILFFQDNGGCAEGMGRGAESKASRQASVLPSLPKLAAEYLQPDMIPKQTRDGFPVRQGMGILPGGADTYLGYGEAWANVSNTPYREYKHWVHEGGISTPLIAHWPAGIPATRHNALESQPAHLIDLMATCVNLAEANYPKEFQGESIQPMEGVSLVPAFSGKPLNRTQPIFWEHEGNRAIREGDWKLVKKNRGKWELYNIAVDRVEGRDLVSEHADRVATMSKQWQTWAERVGIRPWPINKNP